MSSQLSFFHLLCASHSTPDEQVENCHEPGDLVDQVDHTTCVWSHSEDGPNRLRLMMPVFFFESTSCFHIFGTLRSSDLNGSSKEEWFANVQVDNPQIFALKFLCLGYKLPDQLRIEQIQYLLRFSADKREVLKLLSYFYTQEDLECHLRPLAWEKYLFIMQMESGV